MSEERAAAPSPQPYARSGGLFSRNAVALLALLPVVWLIVLALAQPLVSGDLWWHLHTGQWIVENGELPATDPFSHTAGDTPWTLEEYGSQVLYALIHDHLGGLTALRVVGTLLALLVLYCVFRTARRAVAAPWAAFFTALFALLFALKWELRPHLTSVFFLLWIESALFPRSRTGERHDPGPRQWLAIFLLTAVWVQLHAEALFVPIFTAAGLIGAFLGGHLEHDGGARRVKAWLIAFVCAVAGNLCSPFGTKPIVYALFHRAVPQQFIEEWFRPWVLPGDPRFAPLTMGVFVATVIGFAIGSVTVANQALARFGGERRPARVLSWERIGFLAVCVVMALQARRFFFLLWFPLLDAGLLMLRTRHALATSRAVPAALALALALPLSRSHYVALGQKALERGDWSEVTSAELFPVHAMEVIRDAGLEGNLYHPYEWGGFLGFWLREKCPVFIDGRTVLFGDVIVERWTAERDRSVAAEVFERRDVRIVVMDRLVDHGEGVYAWRPPRHEEWRRAWADRRIVVWVRAEDEENLERLRAYYDGLGVELDPDGSFNEVRALRAQPSWLVERQLLPAIVSAKLGGSLSAVDRAAIFVEHRMLRLAATELELLLAPRPDELPDETLGMARTILETRGPAALLLWLDQDPARDLAVRGNELICELPIADEPDEESDE